MVCVDIFVPFYGRHFEFRCDEMLMVQDICKTVREILEKVEGGEAVQNIDLNDEFWLCSISQQKILKKTSTFRESGIKNGSRLIWL